MYGLTHPIVPRCFASNILKHIDVIMRKNPLNVSQYFCKCFILHATATLAMLVSNNGFTLMDVCFSFKLARRRYWSTRLQRRLPLPDWM